MLQEDSETVDVEENLVLPEKLEIVVERHQKPVDMRADFGFIYDCTAPSAEDMDLALDEEKRSVDAIATDSALSSVSPQCAGA